MTPVDLNAVSQYVENNISDFHTSKLEKVKSLDLREVLLAKNPYLFKAKNVTRASEIVESILTAFISSSEEGIFGNWLERLAIFINDSVYHGRKAGIPGIDLDFDKEDGVRYLVAIKSGPNWGNSDQINNMLDNFDTARRRLATSGSIVNIKFVNGCCYGRSHPLRELKRRGYYKMCGQRFWELISGDPNLYTELIVPIGHEAQERNEEFNQAYGDLVNRFTREFLMEYCDSVTGAIEWEKLIKLNSASLDTPRARKVSQKRRKAKADDDVVPPADPFAIRDVPNEERSDRLYTSDDLLGSGEDS